MGAAEQKVQSARDSSTARLIDAAAQDQAELVHQPAQQASPEANGSSQPLKEQSASLEPADDALDIKEAVSKEESDRFFGLYDADGSGSVDMKELLEMVAASSTKPKSRKCGMQMVMAWLRRQNSIRDCFVQQRPILSCSISLEQLLLRRLHSRICHEMGHHK